MFKRMRLRFTSLNQTDIQSPEYKQKEAASAGSVRIWTILRKILISVKSLTAPVLLTFWSPFVVWQVTPAVAPSVSLCSTRCGASCFRSQVWFRSMFHFYDKQIDLVKVGRCLLAFKKTQILRDHSRQMSSLHCFDSLCEDRFGSH